MNYCIQGRWIVYGFGDAIINRLVREIITKNLSRHTTQKKNKNCILKYNILLFHFCYDKVDWMRQGLR